MHDHETETAPQRSTPPRTRGTEQLITCPACGHPARTGRDGAIRKHWCYGPPAAQAVRAPEHARLILVTGTTSHAVITGTDRAPAGVARDHSKLPEGTLFISNAIGVTCRRCRRAEAAYGKQPVRRA